MRFVDCQCIWRWWVIRPLRLWRCQTQKESEPVQDSSVLEGVGGTGLDMEKKSKLPTECKLGIGSGLGNKHHPAQVLPYWEWTALHIMHDPSVCKLTCFTWGFSTPLPLPHQSTNHWSCLPRPSPLLPLSLILLAHCPQTCVPFQAVTNANHLALFGGWHYKSTPLN